jgi:hypothetical protein
VLAWAEALRLRFRAVLLGTLASASSDSESEYCTRGARDVDMVGLAWVGLQGVGSAVTTLTEDGPCVLVPPRGNRRPTRMT